MGAYFKLLSQKTIYNLVNLQEKAAHYAGKASN